MTKHSLLSQLFSKDFESHSFQTGKKYYVGKIQLALQQDLNRALENDDIRVVRAGYLGTYEGELEVDMRTDIEILIPSDSREIIIMAGLFVEGLDDIVDAWAEFYLDEGGDIFKIEASS